MKPITREARLNALAQRSSYVESVLRQALIAQLSSVAWQRDPDETLQVLSSEVDDAGFDIILAYRGASRPIQLKQAHNEKKRGHCSIRLSFSKMPGSCVILMSHTLDELKLDGCQFFGGAPGEPMSAIDGFKPSKTPGRRDGAGRRKVRTHYRDVPVNRFTALLSADALFDKLFPPPDEPVVEHDAEDSPSGPVVPVSSVPTGAHCRTWTLREDNHAHYSSIVRLSESPLYLELLWRAGKQTPVGRIGLFKLDLRRLLDGGYLRTESAGTNLLRLRIKHARNGKFYIQIKDGSPRKVLFGASVAGQV